MTPKSTTWFPAGFILLFGLTFFLALAARASPGDTLYVQSKSVNVYDAPSANAPVVMQLNQGQKLKEFRRQGEWVKVIIYGEVGKEGWVEESLIGPKPLADTTTENQIPEEPISRGAIETPKPKAKSLLHMFALRVIGSGRIKGICRYKTENGAVRRFKVVLSHQIKAKAIKCDVSSDSIQARLRVELWGDGKLLSLARIRSGAKIIPCGPSLRRRLCAPSTRRQLSAYWW
jgi:hypothetical protein